ncbi:hypothetical protein OIO90_005664 [Microbotryomycetes sp. JL221]|nr:hypothetical protein OIO90_005664 [Microbotryomycetes sp. JL221]
MVERSDERRFKVVIELFDHTSLQLRERTNALWPSTPTRLPNSLDQQLRSIPTHKLVLPKDFWCPLPTTTTATKTTTVTGTGSNTVGGRSTRAWTETLGPISPPAIATASLWTPSQPTPGDQQPVLDFRFGPLTLDWIDSPTPKRTATMSPSSLTRTTPNVGASSPNDSNSINNNNDYFRRPTLSPHQTSTSPPLTTVAAAAGRPRASSTAPIVTSSRPPERQGSTDLNWGVVHLFREAGAYVDDSTDKLKRKAMNDDDGTIVGLVSVPGNITASSILTFISPALESIAQLRMIKDSTPNRTIVLIRFHDAADANEFRIMYNGRAYYDTKDSEVAQVVPVSSIQLKTTATPPFTFPYSPTDVVVDSNMTNNLVELPTCPICLERLDVQVSGLIQILCQHSYHCSCLLKWGDSRCPVCRSTNLRTRRGTNHNVGSSTQPVQSTCTVCQSPSNLWICVICGNVGCGRYQGGHAHSHFDDTGHSYSLEIETGRVWSYVDDEYVHRLIRNRTDGKLVELPSSTTTNNIGKIETKDEDVSGPDERADVNQDKLEAIGLEYANLMTTQLESQRHYYEQEIATLKDDNRLLLKRLEEVTNDRNELNNLKFKNQEKFKQIEIEFEKDSKEFEIKIKNLNQQIQQNEQIRKKEKQDWLKYKKQIENEIEQEKSVTTHLSLNLSSLRKEMVQQEQETLKVREQVESMKETMQDLMMNLEMTTKIQQDPNSELAGGTISVGTSLSPPTPPSTNSGKRKSKKR